MIAEAGHYALVLALALALIQSTVPIARRALARCRLDERRALDRARAVRLRRARRSRRWSRCYVTSDFSVVNVFENSHSHEAADLQDHRRLGQSRRLDAAVGVDPGAVRRAGRRCSATICRCRCKRPCAGGAGLDRQRVLSVHPDHLESVPAHRRSADRGPRPQSGAAGHRPRRASADALSRLCRLLDRVLVRDRRADRRPDRRGLGALGAAVDAGWPGCS